MADGRDVSGDVTVDTHSLLLSLAGTLDDELLGWCRELVAVGEADYAVELVAAAVQADRVRLPAGPREQLHDAATRRHLLGRDESLPAADTSARMRHRFVADPVAGGFPAPPADASPEQALAGVPTRMLRNCQLWVTWRATPAGSAPGPLPHPVVLIETDELDGADVLAYQVAEVLRGVGVFASIEVFASGAELGDYHRAALAEARRVEPAGSTDASRPNGSVPNGAAPRAPRAESPANGAEARSGAARRPEARPGPVAGASETSRSTPLRPVDRVIAARGSAPPRRPRPDRPEGGDRPDAGFDEIASGLTFDRPSVDPDERAESAPPPASPASPASPPAASANGEPRRPGPPPRPHPTAGGERPGPGRPTPPGGGSGKRPAGRPDDSGAPLSDVEQRLLRQLHEELAAREDPNAPPDGPAVYRGGNGGGTPRPHRPGDPPRDRK
jgi:hypothetical protein